jgi:hypothetical protein
MTIRADIKIHRRFVPLAIGICLLAGTAIIGWRMLPASRANGLGGGSDVNLPDNGSHSTRQPQMDANLREYDFPGRAKACRSKRDLESLLAEILAVPKTARFPGDGLEELFARWFETDPSGALARIGELGGETRAIPGFGLRALKCGIEAYVTKPNILDAMAEKILEESDLEAFRMELFGKLGKANPAGGIELLGSIHPTGRQDLFKRLCLSWGPVDKRGVIIAISSFDNPSADELHRRVRILFPGRVDFKDVDWARSEGLPELVVAEITRTAVRHVGREEKFDTIVDLVERGRIGAESYGDLRQALSSERSKEFLENMDYLEKVGIFVPDKESSMVAGALFEQSHSDAFKFFNRLASKPAAQASAAYCISERLLSRNTTDCTNWISSLPPGAVRNEALKPLFAYLERHGEKESLHQWKSLWK